MEGILNFVSIVVIIFGILQIILFFKLWGMTNNISEIKEILKSHSVKEKQIQTSSEANKKNDIDRDIEIEDLVVELKSERQLKVVDITEDGKFQCITPGGISPVGFFKRSEIERFDKYWKK